MIELLAKEGVDASDARSMKIGEALDHLSTLQSKAEGARNNRLRIEKEIRGVEAKLEMCGLSAAAPRFLRSRSHR